MPPVVCPVPPSAALPGIWQGITVCSAPPPAARSATTRPKRKPQRRNRPKAQAPARIKPARARGTERSVARVRTHPGRPAGNDQCVSGREPAWLAQLIEPQQRQPVPVAARAHFADFKPVRVNRGPRRRRRSDNRDREKPALDEAAVFGARGQLLADIAALVPI